MVIDREYQGADALQIYLREMAETPLLTAQEEIALAKRIKRGDAKARARMIKANLRLVVKIARDYAHYGLPLLDVINEGNLGLMKAVERFDPKKGAKLSTYAARRPAASERWWIFWPKRAPQVFPRAPRSGSNNPSAAPCPTSRARSDCP